MRTVISFALVLLFAISAFAAGQMTKEKEALAREAVELIQLEKTYIKSLEAMFDAYPPEQRPMMKEFGKTMNFNRTMEASVFSLATNFTVEELQYINDFYTTPMGKSIANKMIIFNQEVGIVLQQDIMEQLQNFLQSGGASPEKNSDL